MTSAVGAWVDKEKLSLAAQTQDAVSNQVFWHCKHHLLTPRKIFGKNYLYIDIDNFGNSLCWWMEWYVESTNLGHVRRPYKSH